jgi:IS30 family transposase
VWTLEATGWSVQDDEDSLDDKVRKAILSLKFASASEVAKALDVHKSTISRIIDRLDVTGDLKRPKVAEAFDTAKAHRREDADPFGEPDGAVEVETEAAF